MMRIVMVTDDGHPIDRRILLEAQALVEAGDEVIVIARANTPAGGCTSYVSNGVKVLHIDFDLGYLGGMDRASAAPGIAAPPGPPAGLARRLVSQLRRIVEGQRVRAALIYQQARGGRTRAAAEFGSALRNWTAREPGSGRGHLARTLAATALGYAAWQALFLGLDGVRTLYRLLAQRARRTQVKSIHVGETEIAFNAWEEVVLHRLVYFDPDVIHCHDLPQLLPAVLAARQLGVPLIYDAHEIYPEISTLTARQKDELTLKEAALVHHCDIVISVNPFCARHMREAYGLETIDLVLNATMPNGRTGQPDLLRKALGLAPEDRILMYQGWMADVGRGLVELVEAMAATPRHIHLVMMGYGDSDLFLRIARLNGVADRVHVMGPVPWHELVDWSASADVGIIPYQPVDLNHRYCSPNKLFEFIAARLPILANDLPFLRQVVAGEGFGLVRPMATAAEMAAAIRDMFGEEGAHLAAARRALVERGAAWEWPRQAEELRQLYARIRQPGFRARAAQPPAQ